MPAERNSGTFAARRVFARSAQHARRPGFDPLVEQPATAGPQTAVVVALGSAVALVSPLLPASGHGGDSASVPRAVGAIHRRSRIRRARLPTGRRQFAGRAVRVRFRQPDRRPANQLAVDIADRSPRQRAGVRPRIGIGRRRVAIRRADERRLFYVAMTRARKTLALCCRQGGRHAFIAECEPLCLKSRGQRSRALAAHWSESGLPTVAGSVVLARLFCRRPADTPGAGRAWIGAANWCCANAATAARLGTGRRQRHRGRPYGPGIPAAARPHRRGQSGGGAGAG